MAIKFRAKVSKTGERYIINIPTNYVEDVEAGKIYEVRLDEVGKK